MIHFKYIILLFLFIFPSIFINGQIRLGVKGGVNISEIRLSDEVFENSNITGFQVGPSMEVMFPAFLGLDASVLYSQRGLKATDNSGNSHETRTDYIDVPVNLKFKAGVPSLKFYIATGPYVSFRISGDNSINGISNEINDQWKAQSFQAGINAGAGVELFKSIQIGANYMIGLTDDYSSKVYDAKDRTWSVTASVFF